MRKSLFLITLFISSLFLATSLSAQIYMTGTHTDSDYGIKVGGSYSAISGSAFNNAYNGGYVAGIYYAKHWNKTGLRIEALVNNGSYTTKGAASAPLTEAQVRSFHITDSMGKGEFSAMYLTVPILLEIKLAKGVFFELGPQYSYMLSVKDNNGVYTKDFKNDNIFKTGEVDFDFGINVNLTSRFNLGLRYAVGLSNVNNDKYVHEFDPWTESAAQLSISYKFKK